MALPNTRSVGDLMDLLFQAETAAQTLYLQLMEAFAYEPEAAEVWWKMGADEAAHIRLLEQIRASLPSERLLEPADPLWLEQARAAARFSPEQILARIHTLEDGYQEAHALENGEINAVFEFVMTEYFPKPLRAGFVRNMLREHVNRLYGLRTAEWRRSISKQPATG